MSIRSLKQIPRTAHNPEHRFARVPFSVPFLVSFSRTFFDRQDKVPNTTFPIESSLIDVMTLYSVAFAKNPTNVLEIGRYKGHSTLPLAAAIADLNGNLNSTGMVYSVDMVDRISDSVKDLLDGYVVYVNQSSSTLMDNVLINQIKFDLCFIDGDHSYDMTLSDLETCISLSSDNACILVHDQHNPIVCQAISDVLLKYDFLSDGGFHSMIRVINVSKPT